MENAEVVNYCIQWLECAKHESGKLKDEQIALFEAFYHVTTLAVTDMRDLLRMEEAQLGHLAGSQVRGLLEASMVVGDMRVHEDADLPKKVLEAHKKRRGFLPDQIKSSEKRFKTYWKEHGYPTLPGIGNRWQIYNSVSHFSLRKRPAPQSGYQMVRDGISIGYLIINEFALFLDKHIPRKGKTEALRRAEVDLELVERL